MTDWATFMENMHPLTKSHFEDLIGIGGFLGWIMDEWEYDLSTHPDLEEQCKTLLVDINNLVRDLIPESLRIPEKENK